MSYRLTPRSVVRARFRFWRFANKLSHLVVLLTVAACVLRGITPLILWPAVIMSAIASARWDHWRAERLAIHGLLIGFHRAKRGRSQAL